MPSTMTPDEQLGEKIDGVARSRGRWNRAPKASLTAGAAPQTGTPPVTDPGSGLMIPAEIASKLLATTPAPTDAPEPPVPATVADPDAGPLRAQVAEPAEPPVSEANEQDDYDRWIEEQATTANRPILQTLGVGTASVTPPAAVARRTVRRTRLGAYARVTGHGRDHARTFEQGNEPVHDHTAVRLTRKRTALALLALASIGTATAVASGTFSSGPRPAAATRLGTASPLGFRASVSAAAATLTTALSAAKDGAVDTHSKAGSRPHHHRRPHNTTSTASRSSGAASTRAYAPPARTTHSSPPAGSYTPASSTPTASSQTKTSQTTSHGSGPTASDPVLGSVSTPSG